MVKAPKEVSADVLARTLTMSVVEVEEIISQAESLDKVLLGEVIAINTHPNADKLKLATVDIGNEKVEVVCGGVNLSEGMKVAFAQIGARVKWHGQGELITLEKAAIRGVESNGMICAAEELGLVDAKATEHGIMDLSEYPDKIGTPLAQVLKYNDLIIAVDNKSITHRPDLWGHLGLARELAALWQTKLVIPKLADIKSTDGASLSVKIQEPKFCQRYLGIILNNVKVGESPIWLKNRLQALGFRPINNVVDVANFVMAEIGQPLHTFDLKKLSSPEITVRKATAGEIIKTLDEIERMLDANTLVIADKKQAIAIAGIIGGLNSAVDEKTTSLVIESANFDAVSVRKTAGKLGFRTEASSRFEKALDPNLAEVGIKRFVYLLQEICPEVTVGSNLVDEYPSVPQTTTIKVSPTWLNERLGTKLASKTIKDILESLGFAVNPSSPPLERGGSIEWEVAVPSFRATRDISIPEDLIEEVARIYGYDKIKPTLPKFDVKNQVQDKAQELRWKIREILVGVGFTENLSYSFVSKQTLAALPSEVLAVLPIPVDKLLELKNPVNQAESFLRPGLIPNMATQLVLNALHLPHQPIQIFELGRVFTNLEGEFKASTAKNNLPTQPWHLALAVRLPGNEVALTYQTLRGAIEAIGKNLGVTFQFVPVGKMSAKIMVSGKPVGGLAITQFMKSSLKPLVALAEIDLEQL